MLIRTLRLCRHTRETAIDGTLLKLAFRLCNPTDSTTSALARRLMVATTVALDSLDWTGLAAVLPIIQGLEHLFAEGSRVEDESARAALNLASRFFEERDRKGWDLGFFDAAIQSPSTMRSLTHYIDAMGRRSDRESLPFPRELFSRFIGRLYRTERARATEDFKRAISRLDPKDLELEPEMMD